MKKLKKDLQVATRQAKALNAKLDKLIKEVAKLSKPAAAKKKAAPKKKAPAKKKVAAKKAPAKQLTVIDTILNTIKKTKKGMTIAQLKEKTEFNSKQLSNALYKLTKKGKIEAKSRGLYVKK